MIVTEQSLPPEIALDEDSLLSFLNKNYGEGKKCRVRKRSIDARQKQIKVHLTIEVYEENEELASRISWHPERLPSVESNDRVVIVGSGPAGMFAALRAIELGLKPILLERGKDVRARRRDLAAINRSHKVNPNSNYCFGEGGAGTYSDGKLYTRSKKRGDLNQVLEILVAHGASEDILIDAHPHIGTNKLPKIIQNIRNTILDHGGEVHFDTCVTDFMIKNGQMVGVVSGDTQHEGKAVLLATGHSSRDIFGILNNKGVLIEAKPYALGLRVEHPQRQIDSLQYHCESRGDYLPAASYALKAQVQGQEQAKAVFSFCMCPGGFIVPSATADGEVVVNGMSPSRRNSRFANSGIVVSVDHHDFIKYSEKGALAGLEYQKAIERAACTLAGNTQAAPAQRLADFVNGSVSNDLPDCSYQPGLTSLDLSEVLPKAITSSLKKAFRQFDKKSKGYLTNDAVLVGVESRTSSPVQIPRDRFTREHPEVKRFFPCGEGAGYAGGIVSAAIDGAKCVEKIAELYFK